MPTTVKTILKEKGTQLWSVPPDTKLIDVLHIMAEQDIGSLLVLKGETLTGIISERDFVRKIVEKGDCPLYRPVAEMMTTDVITVTPSDGIENCMKLMTEKRIRHLPVVENNKPIGMISIGDVIKAILESKEFTIHQMENYISGST
jgi:CBS domain-containing protein